MSLAHIRKPTLIVLSLLLALAVLSLAPQPAAPASGGNAIALKAPSFISVANAQEEPAAAPMGFPQDEAGISAYFKSASPVTLADVRSVFRVIEVETADYIIGSVPVPDYEERYDVHVYVHRDGWFLAYYLSADPVGKIFDWRHFTNAIPTKFENVLATVSAAAGVPYPGITYYDFRYPNATHMMLIVEDSDNGNSFQINMPGTYSYLARSWSLYHNGWCCGDWAGWGLDGEWIHEQSGRYVVTSEGDLTASQLLPDRYHTIVAGIGTAFARAGLALIYRVP